MKNFKGIKICLYLPFKYENTFNNAMFKWFWTIFSLGAPAYCRTSGNKPGFNELFAFYL